MPINFSNSTQIPNPRSLELLQGLVRRQRRPPTDPYLVRRESEIHSGLDDLIPEADSPEVRDAQNASGGAYSRDSIRSEGMTKLRQKLNLDAREHEQEMETTGLKEQGLLERAKLLGGDSGGKPYFIPLQTGGGIESFDTRTGTTVGRVGDLKPADGAQKSLADVGNTLFRAREVNRLMKPEWLGPLSGRLSTMDVALFGDDARKAEFQGNLEGLRNTVINLRTGAQMSEHEAQRILAELPGFNLSPKAFMGRMESATRGLEDWYQRRHSMATGHPENTPPVGSQPLTGGATTGTSAQDLINKYRRAR